MTTNLGMQASAMKTRSMLQAMTGIWGTVCTSVGASVGLPWVSSKSRRSCRFDSQWVGSPISRMASTRGKLGFSLYCPFACNKNKECLCQSLLRIELNFICKRKTSSFHSFLCYNIFLNFRLCAALLSTLRNSASNQVCVSLFAT